MASELQAALSFSLLCRLVPDITEGLDGTVMRADAIQEDRWVQGTGSGQADRSYMRIRTIPSAATDAYNTLLAGALRDIHGQTIDLDEIKALVLRCTSGAIKLVASAGTPMGIFLAAGDGIPLVAGQYVVFGLGAAGLNVAVNSLFEITETTGTGSSGYELAFVGAQ